MEREGSPNPPPGGDAHVAAEDVSGGWGRGLGGGSSCINRHPLQHSCRGQVLQHSTWFCKCVCVMCGSPARVQEADAAVKAACIQGSAPTL